jgi:hypothetical protein
MSLPALVVDAHAHIFTIEKWRQVIQSAGVDTL